MLEDRRVAWIKYKNRNLRKAVSLRTRSCRALCHRCKYNCTLGLTTRIRLALEKNRQGPYGVAIVGLWSAEIATDVSLRHTPGGYRDCQNAIQHKNGRGHRAGKTLSRTSSSKDHRTGNNSVSRVTGGGGNGQGRNGDGNNLVGVHFGRFLECRLRMTNCRKKKMLSRPKADWDSQ